jgi:hypothetical protein
MPGPSRTEAWRWLRPWPLLIAAVATFVAGSRLLVSDDARQLAAAALIVIGAVCVGAWIAMLAGHDYPGYDPPDIDPPGAADQTAERVDPPSPTQTPARTPAPRGGLAGPNPEERP